jgi:hypothetical protein
MVNLKSQVSSLLLCLFTLAGCLEPAQTFPDETDMSRNNRNPPVAPVPPHGMPQVVATTPREGLWSGYNQLGYQAKYGPDQRQTQTILKLDEWGAPEVWTISLYIKQKFLDFTGIGVKARINFGAGGATQVYECDWLNGTQISLPMNAVNVEAVFEDVDVTTEGPGLEVGVMLARGSRGGTRPPVYTIVENLEVAADNQTVFMDVPEFTKRLVLMPASDTLAQLASFYSVNTQLVVNSSKFLSGDFVGVGDGAHLSDGLIAVPLVGKGRAVAIRNRAGSAINVTLFAELDG